MGTLFVEVPLGNRFLCAPPCPLAKPGKSPHQYKKLKNMRKHARDHHQVTCVTYVSRLCRRTDKETETCVNHSKNHLLQAHGLAWQDTGLPRTRCSWRLADIAGRSPPPSPESPFPDQPAPGSQAATPSPVPGGLPRASPQASGPRTSPVAYDVLEVMSEDVRRNTRVERCIAGSGSADKPDIVVMNTTTKTALIVDICCPFEKRYHALEVARRYKEDKYEHLVQHLRGRGFEASAAAIVVGSLGS
ncbi:hypothetical protein FOCC_FOCC015412 [Frankliniella occidentalis]|nr:hypothetical protein FOCC_FOCC015412 [Frankliniella occidentalis]